MSYDYLFNLFFMRPKRFDVKQIFKAAMGQTTALLSLSSNFMLK